MIVTTPNGYRVLSDEREQRAEWLSMVYADESLVTQHKPHAAGYTLPNGEPVHVPTSSSTMPSLMARMLEALDLRDGQRVLEIGTGTGYNAALLSYRLGASQVVSIDIDPDLVETARVRLATLGHWPTVLTGDGTAELREHSPYDRIIATAAVADIPLAWIEQLTPGGKILANVRGDLAGGTLCLLTKDATDDEVIGPVLPIGGHFMWARPDANDPHHSHEHVVPPERTGSSRTATRIDATDLVDDEAFRFLLQLHLHGAQQFYRSRAFDPHTRDERDAVIVAAGDGSRAVAFTEPEPDGTRRVIQTGPQRLWNAVETAVHDWHDLNHPDPGRFGIVANRTTQFVWLDSDESWYHWPLPLV
ncbi:MAG: methyltransferase domain-containing protein [Haloechinothrix sp.]